MPELKALLPVHYEELSLHKGKFPLDPDYPQYIAREHRGELLFVTVRRDAELVGYFIGFISPGLHYKTCLTCIMDIFYVKIDARGEGAGTLLFKTVEDILEKRGVNLMFVGSKNHRSASFLFEKLGYEPVETYYQKWF